MLHLEIKVLFCGSGKYHIEEQFYELTDHLGNVRATLSDRKLTGSPGSGPYYADIRSYNHPYPFGMPQPKRFWDSVEYRYGFNGMETDPEVKGTRDHHYTTHFRQYDPRIGRWWSHDPVTQIGESPYAAMFNNPVYFSDPMRDNPCQGCPQDASEGDTYTDQGGGEWTYNQGTWVQQLALLEPRPIVLPQGFREVIQHAASGTSSSGSIQNDQAFQDQDANKVQNTYIYRDRNRVPSTSTTEMVGSHRVSAIGIAPEMSIGDPLWSGAVESRNNPEVVKLISFEANQVLWDPKASFSSKVAAGVINSYVSRRR